MEPDTLRLVAEVTVPAPAGGPIARWLRILGDDRRGYLLVGDVDPEVGPALEDIWFPTLDEAFAAAERVGVPRAAWNAED